jgi:hypothetical protein
LNENTEDNAVIVGKKHWRGFMELYLAQNRTYIYSDDPSSLAVAEAGQGKDTYLISAHGSPQTTFTIREMSIKR